MSSKAQLTGMTGVYLVAAELSRRGYLASPTSRSAQGADLLVSDVNGIRPRAVQVKTNATTFNFWLLNAKAQNLKARGLVYALVNLRKDRTEYYLVPSKFVAENMEIGKRKTGSIWYSIRLSKIARFKDHWGIFGDAGAPTSR